MNKFYPKSNEVDFVNNLCLQKGRDQHKMCMHTMHAAQEVKIEA